VTETDRYSKAWQDRRSRIFSILAVVVVLLASLRMWPDPLVIGGCLVGIAVAAYRFYDFRCPRCRERFLAFQKDGLSVLSRQRCQHCHLEKNTVPKESRR
jgi:ribosomal protein S27AE